MNNPSFLGDWKAQNFRPLLPFGTILQGGMSEEVGPKKPEDIFFYEVMVSRDKCTVLRSCTPGKPWWMWSRKHHCWKRIDEFDVMKIRTYVQV